MAKRGGKRTIYQTKSGSFYGSRRTKKTQRGKPAKRMSRAEHRSLNTLSHRRRQAAHARRKGR